MIVRSRAPLRLGIAGGGTDVSPYCDQYGGYVLNATINKYAYATIENNSSGHVELVAVDQNLSATYETCSHICNDGVLDLHKAVYNRIVRQFNNNVALPLRITTFCEAPAGSGLGSSSTIVVAMVSAFAEWMSLPLGEYDLARLAYEIERIDAGLNGGKQDQYAAAFGGFNFVEFYSNDRVIVNPLRVKNWIISELEASLVLFYMGRSRDSAKIIDEQASNVEGGNKESVDAMHKLKEEAVHTKECLLKGDFEGLAESMSISWTSKKRTAKAITNHDINRVYDHIIRSGAKAGKVSGAGGGGYMMFLVDPARRVEVIRALSKLDGQVMDCYFNKHGAHAWRID
jgi:D-glycero-alpha-D-manno-heptose-7-phosphate kinase